MLPEDYTAQLLSGYWAQHMLCCCRLLRRMLTDLHQLQIVSEQALETWRYRTSDTEAIEDVSSWLNELKESQDMLKEDSKPEQYTDAGARASKTDLHSVKLQLQCPQRCACVPSREHFRGRA